MANANFDPTLDLELTRDVKLPRHLIWRAWTEPEHLMPWFCPKPWQTIECNIDLRPGGKFHTVMRGPNGESHDNTGCYLDVVAPERLVFTSVLGPGYRPVPQTFLSWTAVLTFSEIAGGTRYHVHAMHLDAETRNKHSEIGFDKGWNTALDQLIAHLGGKP